MQSKTRVLLLCFRIYIEREKKNKTLRLQNNLLDHNETTEIIAGISVEDSKGTVEILNTKIFCIYS